jgi:hypothetical protein
VVFSLRVTMTHSSPFLDAAVTVPCDGSMRTLFAAWPCVTGTGGCGQHQSSLAFSHPAACLGDTQPVTREPA